MTSMIKVCSNVVHGQRDEYHADALHPLEVPGCIWKLIDANEFVDRYSVGPSIRPISTICCLPMTNLVQVCSNVARG